MFYIFVLNKGSFTTNTKNFLEIKKKIIDMPPKSENFTLIDKIIDPVTKKEYTDVDNIKNKLVTIERLNS